MSLLIRQALLENQPRDIWIEEGKILSIEKQTDRPADRILEGSNRAVLPAFHNGHTHSPMTLLRGYGDDMPLFPWLQEKIWPAESRYKEEDFYWGYKLAFLEMIKGGTCFFNDMYFQQDIALQALEESGMKGAINFVFLHSETPEQEKEVFRSCEGWFDQIQNRKSAAFAGLAPHSIYTVSEKSLRWIRDFARERDLKVHIHLSETEQENLDCFSLRGISPTEWLDKLGLTSCRLSVAHGLWLSERDRDILAEHRVPVVYNPGSNMKLSSGPALDFSDLKARGIPVILGTDGCSSNNNLSMLEEMKLAALLQKQHYGDPTRLKAREVFFSATKAGADFWETGSGEIKVGATADLMLVRLDIAEMVPCHNLISNLVYSAPRSAVSDLIVDGEIVMENGSVPQEQEIIQQARKRSKELIERRVK